MMAIMQSDIGEKLLDDAYYPEQVQKWKLCRLCAKESYNLIQIFNEEGKNKQIEMKINTLLPIQVNENDILPLQICLWCYSALEMAFKLQESSIAADKALVTLFGDRSQKCLDEVNKKSHMLRFHREYKPYECEMCNKRYHVKCDLKNHMHIHSSTISTFLCDSCGCCFASPILLLNHIHRGHNTKPCLFCNKQFGQLLMKRHMNREHFHERKYRCDICYNSFYSTTDVEYHKKLHRSKRVECHFCGKIFSLASSLNTHLENKHQNNTGGYTCPVKSCRQQFALTYGILNHCVGHSKDDFSKPRLEKRDKLKLLMCQYCDASFRYMSQYLYHIKEHDPGVMTLVCGICNEEHSSDMTSRDTRGSL
ncbi:hypothetical protein B566_EDAN011405 [Ephemera danica]|nr:hypothetical protein B566_EDAN011405 [Ephemera danica]